MAPITDEEWADLVADELPRESDPVMQKYRESRRALMAEEHKQRSDSLFRQALSPIAAQACAIASRIRSEECTTAAATTSPPSSTKSWHIMRRLPKGVLLRAHVRALADTTHLVDVALRTPGMRISSPAGALATAEARSAAAPRIRFFRPAAAHDGPNPDDDDDDDCGGGGRALWTDGYQPGRFVPLAEAADSYPDGGRQGFVEWLVGRCRCRGRGTSSGRQQQQQQQQDADDVVVGMMYYEPIWRAFLRRLMVSLIQDGIYWLELRLDFPVAYYREGSERRDPDYDHMFQAAGEEVAKFRAAHPERPPFWGLRVIWSTRRSQDQDPRSIVEDADSCIATKLAWPDLVAGYDLAGPGSLDGSLRELFWFRKQCALEDVQIPFFLGARDSADDDDDDDNNLFDALLLGSRRIGNALSLDRHPRLMEAVRDRRILVETCCPGLAGGTARHHPLPVLLAQGVPCALCCDDRDGHLPGQDAAEAPMTNVFWQAFRAFDCLDLAALGSLAENSVRWAAFEDQDAETWARDIRAASVGSGIKAARLQQWAVEWERFCLWVATEYGDAYGDDTMGGGG